MSLAQPEKNPKLVVCRDSTAKELSQFLDHDYVQALDGTSSGYAGRLTKLTKAYATIDQPGNGPAKFKIGDHTFIIHPTKNEKLAGFVARDVDTAVDGIRHSVVCLECNATIGNRRYGQEDAWIYRGHLENRHDQALDALWASGLAMVRPGAWNLTMHDTNYQILRSDAAQYSYYHLYPGHVEEGRHPLLMEQIFNSGSMVQTALAARIHTDDPDSLTPSGEIPDECLEASIRATAEAFSRLAHHSEDDLAQVGHWQYSVRVFDDPARGSWLYSHRGTRREAQLACLREWWDNDETHPLLGQLYGETAL
ncbi:hypothetical protein [Kitasatospora sp. NPDC098663]|uniref:hypothetical protein n=1 Tax=Kitasatospora sp. NPDC098663 TaxID=3364096 RepID=UPI003809A5F9